MSEMESKSVRDSGALSQFRQDAFDDESDKRFHELLHALPVGVYTTDTVGRITFFNQTAATMWGRRPKLNSEQWCGSWRMYWPDGIALPHHECPMAVAIKQGRSLNGGGQEAVVERPDGTRVPFMAFPSILRDATGEVVGAVNMFVDITERKRSEEQISILAREAEHRAKNVLAIVQATVHLSQSDTAAGLKHAIEGRIRALANVHRLFVESRWSGAELRSVVSQSFRPIVRMGKRGCGLTARPCCWNRKPRKRLPLPYTSWQPTRPSTGPCRCRLERFESSGHARSTAKSCFVGPKQMVRPPHPPLDAASARASWRA